MSGGGTLNTWPGISSSASLGGRGGGGGPGLASPDPEGPLEWLLAMGVASLANLPASAIGGGTLKRGCEDTGVDGGEGVLSGVSGLGGDGARPGTGLLDGGGAGGGPRLLDEEAPVLSGVSR